MIYKTFLFLVFLALSGCATHTTTSHQKMMENVIGELDRETGR